jgi:hypothetical protein
MVGRAFRSAHRMKEKKVMATQKLTSEQFAKLMFAKVDDVMSVYSGKPGKCCCGCAGSHRYNSSHQAAAGTHRGYAVTADEVNDRQISMVLLLLKKHYMIAEGSDTYVSAEINGRLYTVYYM